MIALDPSEPTEQERIDGAITKHRYMMFRERESSTGTLGFRVDVAKISTREDIGEVFAEFFEGRQNHQKKIVELLRSMRKKIEASRFFKEHEVVGSSILLICDSRKVGVWLIDFAKCTKVPNGMQLNHRTDENTDGYLFGMDNLIQIMEASQVREVEITKL
ncbi:inositol polyphosphate kinase domain-containing protein [Ditylenchus destructor]|uniref:Kinase n=1 Tax=Ditylenchus destructor TaxID=166010 RepID=A0AAD4MW76_9BILA|nr:inositol polyphosphate kinase domain-containing protein [Ditylenchus destructor]